MEPSSNRQSEQGQTQSGKQIAFGIAVYIFGAILLLSLLKYLTG